jgi:hypothetical protein
MKYVIEGKGKGLFALRSFQKGDKVLIERLVLKFDYGFNARENVIDDYEQLPESIQSAIDDLHMVNADHYSRSLSVPTIWPTLNYESFATDSHFL